MKNMKRTGKARSLAGHLYRYSLAVIGIIVLATALWSCADEYLEVQNGNKNKGGNQLLDSNRGGSAMDVTSVITLSADAGMQRPPIQRGMERTGDEEATRSIVLNDKFMPVAEGSDLKARIFLVKYDESLKDQYGRLDDKKCKLAAAEIIWDKVTTLNGGGVSLQAHPQKITLHWVNEEDQNKAVDINPGEDWRVCGIIGGQYDETVKPGYKYVDKNGNPQIVDDSNWKLYYTYVDFNPKDRLVKEIHNVKDNLGRQRVAAAFGTGWKKLEVKEKNVINIGNWQYKALGVLFRIKVKRNTNLLGGDAHNYRFASSQVTASGGFLIGMNVGGSAYNDVGLRATENSLEKYWYWQNENDNLNYYWEHTAQSGSSNEFHYVYNSKKLRATTQDEYDEFYVWGMPHPKVHIQYQDFMSCITLEKGGAMLGRKYMEGNQIKYADEWCYGEGETSEFNRFNFSDKGGKAYSVDLAVVRPRFRAKRSDGKLEFPWPNPLERFAQSNCKVYPGEKNEPGLWNDILFGGTKNKGGFLDGHTLKASDIKIKEMNAITKGQKWLPDNYLLPDGEQWGLALPTIIDPNTGYTQQDGYGFFDGKVSGTKIYKLNRQIFEELLTLSDFQDDGYEFPYQETNEKARINSNKNNRCWSFYWANEYLREIYAIRFDANVKGNSQKYGRRYRCAYRYMFINMADKKWKRKDNGKKGTFDDVNNGDGARLVVQSRWIGNAYVPLDSLQSETWWGPCSTEKGDYRDLDVYRVFPVVGINDEKGHMCGTYWSATYKDIDPHFNKWDASGNNTRFWRHLSWDYVARFYWFNNTVCRPVRAIIRRDYPEDGEWSPRNNIITSGLNRYIKRQWDTDNSWRQGEFRKENFGTK